MATGTLGAFAERSGSAGSSAARANAPGSTPSAAAPAAPAPQPSSARRVIRLCSIGLPSPRLARRGKPHVVCLHHFPHHYPFFLLTPTAGLTGCPVQGCRRRDPAPGESRL